MGTCGPLCPRWRHCDLKARGHAAHLANPPHASRPSWGSRCHGLCGWLGAASTAGLLQSLPDPLRGESILH